MKNDLISTLRCYGCDEELDSNELHCYYEYEGLCEECYSIGMEAAYNIDESSFDTIIIDLEDNIYE